MTTLVVDIGNARIKWARVEGEGIAATGHASHPKAVDDALEEFAAALPNRVHRVVVANVAGDLIAAKLTALTVRRFGIEPEFVSTESETLGVRCGYREPARLGVDRWVAIVAAYHAACAAGASGSSEMLESRDPRARPACVINAGTALTLDAVDAGGQHLGGLIMAGPRIIADALNRNTHRIGATAIAAAAPVGIDLLGKSTDEAVGHGALLGPAAAFDRVIGLIARELGEPPIVFLAGGDGPLLEPWLETPVQTRADFVLEGLALIAAAAPLDRRHANR